MFVPALVLIHLICEVETKFGYSKIMQEELSFPNYINSFKTNWFYFTVLEKVTTVYIYTANAWAFGRLVRKRSFAYFIKLSVVGWYMHHEHANIQIDAKFVQI